MDNKLDEGKVVTIDSYLDHYSARPATVDFQVVIVRPYCSPDPEGSKYEQTAGKWMSFLEHVTSIHLRTISSLGVVKFHPH